jgi:phage gp29-like protein
MAPARLKKSAAEKKIKGPVELGDTGTRILNGVVNEEYNAKLQDTRGIAIYDEMRKSDGTVRAAVLATTLPVRAANWFVKPGSEEQVDLDIAEFVRQALWEQSSITFDDFLRQALLSLPYGVMVFEKVYTTREIDGVTRIVFDKLAPRLPRSIQKWAITDGSFGITQNTSDGKVVDIPGDKLVVFVNEMEGENWWGTSILRAAYKHWFIKNTIYKIDAIAFERQGLGVPFVKLPEGATTADTVKAEEILKNLRANSQAYIIEPQDYEIGFKDMMSDKTRDPQNSLAHHNREIMKSILAQFLELGASSSAGTSGSRALSEDHSDLFLQSLEAIARSFASTVNKQSIKELVDLNFDNVEKYPTLDFEGITETDVKAISDAYKTLVDTGAITPQEADEPYFRENLGLPEYDEAGKRERPAPKNPFGPTEDDSDPDIEASDRRHLKKKYRAFSDGAFNPYRELTFAEKKVNFEALTSKLDELEQQFDKETQALLHEARDRYMATLTRAAHAGDTQAIKDATLKVQNDFSRIIKNATQNAFVYGKNNAAKELGVNAPANPSATLKQIDIQAAAIADMQIAEITTDSKNAYVQALSKGESTTASLAAADAAAAAAIDRLTGNTSSILMAGYVNHGRNVVFDLESESIHALQRSELLDATTCDYCLSVDGRIIEKEDPFGQNTIFHSNCRGIWVAILKDEEELPAIGGIPKTIRDRFGDAVNDLIQPRKPITKKGTPAREEADKREERQH